MHKIDSHTFLWIPLPELNISKLDWAINQTILNLPHERCHCKNVSKNKKARKSSILMEFSIISLLFLYFINILNGWSWQSIKQIQFAMQLKETISHDEK